MGSVHFQVLAPYFLCTKHTAPLPLPPFGGVLLGLGPLGLHAECCHRLFQVLVILLDCCHRLAALVAALDTRIIILEIKNNTVG